MNHFEISAINDQHIAELQAESQNMAFARGLNKKPSMRAKSGRGVRRVGMAFGSAVRAMHVPGVPSRHQPA